MKIFLLCPSLWKGQKGRKKGYTRIARKRVKEKVEGKHYQTTLNAKTK